MGGVSSTSPLRGASETSSFNSDHSLGGGASISIFYRSVVYNVPIRERVPLMYGCAVRFAKMVRWLGSIDIVPRLGSVWFPQCTSTSSTCFRTGINSIWQSFCHASRLQTCGSSACWFTPNNLLQLPKCYLSSPCDPIYGVHVLHKFQSQGSSPCDRCEWSSRSRQGASP